MQTTWHSFTRARHYRRRFSLSFSLSPCLCFCLCSTHRVENRVSREWRIVWSVLALNRATLSVTLISVIELRLDYWHMLRKTSLLTRRYHFFWPSARDVFSYIMWSVLQWMVPDFPSWENCKQVVGNGEETIISIKVRVCFLVYVRLYVSSTLRMINMFVLMESVS